MSHFTVLVTRTNKRDLEDQLAPFDEDLEMPRYIEYTKEQLIEKSKQEVAEYEKRTYAKFLKDPKAYKLDCFNPNHIKYLEEEFPLKLKWTNEQHYVDAVKYYENSEINADGSVTSTLNPQAKWDWWKIGGRWAGFFQARKGSVGVRGENGLGDSNMSENGVDTIRVADIDWEAMEVIEKARRAKYYEEEMAKPEDNRFVWDEVGAKDMTLVQYVNRPVHQATFAVLHDGN